MEYYFSDKIRTLQPSAIREILKFTADPAIIPFAAGNPAPEAFPIEKINEIIADIFAKNPIGALQYSVSEGYPPLREAVKAMVAKKGIGADFDELIIVSGAQQGIEMTSKILCDEGDVILCEDPSFVGGLNAIRSLGTKLVGIPSNEDGIDLIKLEAALKDNRNVRFLYLIPNFQNPTGRTMSEERRKAVYALAKQYGTLILEDDPYGDLRFEGKNVPSIKSLDTDGLVIYVGSFSKILAPGMRVGYLIAPKEIIAKMTVAKQCSDVHSNILAQMICHKFITECDLTAHIAHLQDIYRKKANLMLTEMDKHFGDKVTYTRPQGGLFLWCTLPAHVDMMQFCTTAVKDYQVAVVPGTAFCADEKAPSQSFRMNYSTPTDEAIVKGIARLGELINTL